MNFKTNECLNQKIGKFIILQRYEPVSGILERSQKLYRGRCDCGTEAFLTREQLERNENPCCKRCARRLKVKDLTGKRFGRWIVLELDKHHPYQWICRCQCGIVKNVRAAQLLNGRSVSCGCFRLEQARKERVNNLGRRFGKLRIIRKIDSGHVECECDCGNKKNVYVSSLYTGATISCGCFRVQKMSGSNSRFWKGGITTIIRSIKASSKYWTWVKHVKKRDNYQCQCCLKKDMSRNLHAHHIKNFANNFNLAFDETNGITLCKECHVSFHTTYGKINTNKEQLDKFIKLKRKI